MAHDELLEVVDLDGNIIDTQTREYIHQHGLLHREVHVWFFTPQGQVVFQHRSNTKETFPGKLDATVGGHVDYGMDYIKTAQQETLEEVGLQLNPEQFTLVDIIHSEMHDEQTGLTNNALRARYAYLFLGNPGDLLVEEGQGQGFESYSIIKLENLSPEEKQKFISPLISKEHIKFLKNAWSNLSKNLK